MSMMKKKNIPKSIHEMSKETLQETLKKKRECNAKALQTVEKLCEPSVDEVWLLANLQFINQCHFEDVTVERAIAKICGYPLCNQKLEKVPTQQYHISTRYNKVFDISERKNFCSGCCYKSAMHVKNQLFTSPLWFRDQEVIPKYTVLKSMKSSMGEEVVFFPDNIESEADEPKENSVNSNKPASLNENIEKLNKKCLFHNNIISEPDKPKEKNVNSVTAVNSDKNIEKLVEKCSSLEINDNQEDGVHVNKIETVKNQADSDIGKEIKKSNVVAEGKPVENFKDKVEDSKIKSKRKDGPVDVITKVEKCISEWFSLETFFYLYGEEKLKELLQDKAVAVKEIINSKLMLAGKNEKVNRMIQLYGLLDTDSFSSSEVKTNLKPLPDYSILKEEGKTLEIKVKAFYQGQLQLQQSEKEEKKEEEQKIITDAEPNYLPLIDAHAQTALRKKIVLDKLNRVLPDLMKLFSTDYILQMNEVRNLVSTFTLSAHNITFKPTLWSLVGIILIKLLSIRDKKLESVLRLDSSVSQIILILTSFELHSNYLDNLIIRLTNSGSMMEKLNEINR